MENIEDIEDMENRGFKALIGKTIVAVNEESINSVSLITSDNSIFIIEAEKRHCGIEIIELYAKHSINSFIE
jgi:hypothetical protein